MCVLLDMYEERGEARGIEKGIAQGEARGMKKGIAQGEARGMAKGISQGILQGISQESRKLTHCTNACWRITEWKIYKKQSWIQTTKKNCYRSMG